MGMNSLPKTVTRQRRGCDLNQGQGRSLKKEVGGRLKQDLDKDFLTI